MLKTVDTFSSFSVDDMDKAKQFYGEILGLEISDSPQGLDLHLANNKVFIYAKPNHVPATFTVLNFVVTNIEQTVDELTAAGVKFEIYNEENMKTNEKGITQNAGIPNTGPVIAWFKDPTGNFLSVIQEK